MTVESLRKASEPTFDQLDRAITDLAAAKDNWARTSIDARLAILAAIRDAIMPVAEKWALTAAREKQIPDGSPLVGEEWMSGPYALMSGCDALTETLREMGGKRFLKHVPVRDLPSGQIAATVFPQSIFDRLLLSGVTADVWMQPGVTKANLAANTAGSYDTPAARRTGKVALVLGAGNIAAIAPLDCFQKIFVEHQVTLLKLNPVNDYLYEFLQASLKPLIDADALRIVRGGADIGAYLCDHADVEEIHITGSQASHDAIVWGQGDAGRAAKTKGMPRNARRITSELGAVCPTIVVPGPWSTADIAFQAENIATQKLHNSGFNCIACQMLVMSNGWDQTDALLAKVDSTIKTAPPRGLYYPGAEKRMADFAGRGKTIKLERPGAPACMVIPFAKANDPSLETEEVFAPAISVHRLDAADPEAFLRAAIAYANDRLYGTLGANVLIHPSTLRQIGKAKFETILAELRYGCIAVNAWTALGFLIPQAPWGAFPGHTLDDVRSGIGFVHNSFMFDRPERTIVTAPFRPFPRNVLSGGLTMLPRPPWFVTNTRQHVVARLLTSFQFKPSFAKLPRIFANALRG